MAGWAAALIAAVAAGLAHPPAAAGVGAHYAGHDRRGTEFRAYLDGGEFLGAQGDFHAIRVTVHAMRGGRVRQALQRCVYRFDPLRRERDRLECAASTPGAWAGVTYVRPPRTAPGETGEALETLVCATRCGPGVPRRLTIEGADEDNG